MTEVQTYMKTGLSLQNGGSEPPLPQGSLADILLSNAVEFADRPAVMIPSGDTVETINYAELLTRAENVALWLSSRCEPGDRVALWSDDRERAMGSLGCRRNSVDHNRTIPEHK